MKFKVLAGSHTDINGQVHKKGEVFESAVDLTEVFLNKFTKVNQDVPVKAPVEKVVRTSPPLSESQPTPTPVEPAEQKEAPTEAPPEVPPAEPAVDKGQDVTRRFPLALEEDFLVFRREKRYHVYDKDQPDTVLNESPLRRTGVEPFISKILED